MDGAERNAEAAAAAAASFSFKKAKAQAEAEKRAAGLDGVAFVREGSVGGWHKYFSPEANECLEAFGYRKPMLRLGYPDLY